MQRLPLGGKGRGELPLPPPVAGCRLMRFYDESFAVSVPLRCFPDLSAFGPAFGSKKKRENTASLFQAIYAKKFLIS